MSGGAFGIVPRALLLDRSVGHAAKTLYALLATYANADMECWPSRETLLADTGLSDVRTIRGLLKELEEAGYVERLERFNADGMQIASTFRLCISWRRSQQTRVGQKISGGEDQNCPPHPEPEAPPHPEPEAPPKHTIEEHTQTLPPPPPAGTPQGARTRKGRAKVGDLFEPEERPKPAPKSTRLPDDWQPTAELIEFATTEGFTHAETTRIARDFADYWHAASGAKARKCNWPATWRIWVRRESDKHSLRGAAGGPPNGHARQHGGAGSNPIAAAVASVIAARRAQQNHH